MGSNKKRHQLSMKTDACKLKITTKKVLKNTGAKLRNGFKIK
jgi:hypothetical protein